MLARILHWSTEILFWVAMGTALFATFRNQQRSREYPDGRVSFAPALLGTLAWLFVWGKVGVVCAKPFFNGDLSPWTLTTSALLYIGILVIVSYLPGSIVVDGAQVVQVYWFRPNRKIQWKDIEEIQEEKGSTITLTDSHKKKVVFWLGLPDRPRFLQEIRLHCGANLPPDFPREPAKTV